MKKGKSEEIEAGSPADEILDRLGERVDRAMTAIVQLRKERDALRMRAEKAEEGLKAQDDAAARLLDLESENEQYRSERDGFRGRVEAILAKIESLDELLAE